MEVITTIGIDARMIEMSGIGSYIQGLSQQMDIYDVVLGEREILQRYFPQERLIEYKAPVYGVKEQLYFPYGELNKLKLKLLHVPHYNVPLFYPGKIITTIHDVTHIVFPEYLPHKLALSYARFMISRALKKSQHILTVSENTKRDLVHYFKVDPNKITVVYNGINPNYGIRSINEYDYLYDKYGIPKSKKILLYVGNQKPHKNLERLLYAFAKSKYREESVLVFAGKKFGAYTKLEELAVQLELEKHLIYTGIVSQEDLISLYNLADLFVFPSLYEGFGIPPLEAMACGTPVICSNTSSLPEVVGEAAHMIDPYSINALQEAIDLILEREDLQKELIDKGLERVKRFSWKVCADKTYEIYEKVIKES